MIGTIANCVAIVLGTAIGLLFRKLIRREVWDSVLKALGLVILLMGLIGVFRNIVMISDTHVMNTRFDLLLIIAIAMGTFLGTLMDIDGKLKRFGDFLEKSFKKGSFSEGFISASMIFCVGAMAIFGSVQDALGDPSVLFLKAALDGITAMILATTLGFGVAFSAIPVLVFQGLISLLTIASSGVLTDSLIVAFSAVGYVMVMSIGINFIFPKTIKTANMLPGLLIVILYVLMGLSL